MKFILLGGAERGHWGLSAVKWDWLCERQGRQYIIFLCPPSRVNVFTTMSVMAVRVSSLKPSAFWKIPRPGRSPRACSHSLFLSPLFTFIHFWPALSHKKKAWMFFSCLVVIFRPCEWVGNKGKKRGHILKCWKKKRTRVDTNGKEQSVKIRTSFYSWT